MMNDHGKEWIRSRFWLCYFLHNRHDRLPIAWNRAAEMTDSPILAPMLSYLANFARESGRSDRWIIQQAAQRDGHRDPAFVQSLRLMVKEEQTLAKLAAKFLARYGRSPCIGTSLAKRAQPLRQWLGLRFEMAMLLLMNRIEVTLLTSLRSQPIGDPALADLIDQLLRDRQGHLAFQTERLTWEFADFNFLRRNLRRWRLRWLFAGLIGWTLLTRRSLLAPMPVSRWRLAIDCWRSFKPMLERLVPYHRHALLQALSVQHHHRYDPPLPP